MSIVDTIWIVLARYFIILPAALMLIALYLNRTQWKKFILLSAIAGAIALILFFIASQVYYNPRPFTVGEVPLIPHITNNGFPSGHTLFAATVAVVLLFFSLPLGIIATILAILIALSRIYVKVHHPIDVIGSFLIAIVSCLGVWYLTAPIFTKAK